ncbi:MAG: hypothetical protein U0822_07720 [Anaerolineae bacterium]
MKLLFTSFPSKIYWRIHRDDPRWQGLQSLPNFFFVNPFLYSSIALSSSGAHSQVVAIAGDWAVVVTNGVMLGTTLTMLDPASIPFNIEIPNVINLASTDTSNSKFEVVFIYAHHLVESLRLASRQVDLSRVILSGTFLECEELPTLTFPRSKPNSNIFLQGFLWDTAATWKNLIEADANLTSKTIPIQVGLIIDAIHAYRYGDYRRAILYAAIAVETATATKLDDIAESKGTRDPVYAFLSERRRFAELLHELPLYLTGRSLLVENATLYQAALKLYRTRNKIAHVGEPPQGERSFFALNEESALQAMEIAIQVLQWLGEPTDFPLPKTRFIKMQAPIV